MEPIRKIIRKQLFELYEKELLENTSKAGEYSTEEMEKFLFKLIDLLPLSTENYGSGPNIAIPNSSNSSSVSYTKEAIIEEWNKAKINYSEPDTKWYVWRMNINNTKPVYLSDQRIDINQILDIASKFPKAFRNMSIGVENESTKISAQDIY